MEFSEGTRRKFLVGLGIAAGALTTAASGQFVSRVSAQTSPKTYVLVPGAFFGAWSWKRVTDRLQKQGHKVYPLTLTGLADRSHLLSKDVNLDTHIDDIVKLTEWEDLSDICLVAHSYAGFPASGALERIGSRVSSIVWVDAMKPADGQSFRDVAPFPLEDGAISRPAPKALPPNLYDPKDAEWVLSKVTPHPIGSFLQPIKLSGAREKVVKKTYIRLPKFKLAHLDTAFAECKSDKSWTVIENPDVGHAAMILNPDWLTDVLVKAA